MGTSSENTEQELPEAYWPGLLFYNQSEVGKLLLSWLVDAFMWKFGKFDLNMKNDHFFAALYSYSVWKYSCPVPSSKNILFVQIIFMKTMHPAYKGIYKYLQQHQIFILWDSSPEPSCWLKSDCAKPLQLQTLQSKNERSGKESGTQCSLICSTPPSGSSLAGSWSVFEPEHSAVFWVRGQPWAEAMIREKNPVWPPLCPATE